MSFSDSGIYVCDNFESYEYKYRVKPFYEQSLGLQQSSKLNQELQNIKEYPLPVADIVSSSLPITQLPIILKKERQYDQKVTNEFSSNSYHLLMKSYKPSTIVKQVQDIDDFANLNEGFGTLCLVKKSLIIDLLQQRKQMQETVLMQRRLLQKYERKY